MTSRPRLVGAGALLVALGVLIGTATGGTFAAFSRTTANAGNSFAADRIFPGARNSSAWDVRDASGGGAETNSSAPMAFADGITTTTGNWTSAFSTTRYLDFDLNSSLPAGLGVSGAQFNFRIAGPNPPDDLCFYFEVRTASTGAVLGTHGTTGSPAGCVSGTTQTTVSTSVPELNTTDKANDLRIHVYGTQSKNRPFVIDMATVSGSTPYSPFTLYRTAFTDASTGVPTTNVWSLVAADSAPYTPVANWQTAFSPTRYLKFTFPSYLPATATVTGVVLDHSYRSETAGDTTCVYFEAFTGATLINTFGTSGAPLSCNNLAAFRTDSTSLTNVDTPAEVNGLIIKMYEQNSGARRSQEDQVRLTVTYLLP